ncbi:hypothetical protein HK101_011632 [Irineochytrium annulatum]|nr:hypothetical protein HK101_011632 [Irineochytrium annulatum]
MAMYAASTSLLTALLAAPVFAAAAVPGALAPRNIAPAATLPAGWFTIKNPDGTCWRNSGANTITTAACDATKQDQWWSYALGHLVSSYQKVQCATAPFAKPDGKAPLTLGKCVGSANQLLVLATANSDKQTLRMASDHLCLSGSNFGVVRQVSTGGCDTFTFSDHSVISPPTLPDCSSLSKRREWRDMTAQQRGDYIAAVQGLRSKPSLAGRRSYYDDLVAMHAAAAGMIHGTALFLPWHRKFMTLYEDALKSVVPNAVMAYWDWGSDSPKPAQKQALPDHPSILAHDTTSSFGTHEGEGSNDGFCHDWESENGRPLQRYYDFNGFTVADAPTVNSLVINNEDFLTFAGNLENIHNSFHMGVGGAVSGTDKYGDMVDPLISPNDPIFFLHHANIDRLWGLWQQNHPNIASDFTGTVTQGCVLDKCPQINVDSSYLLPNFNIPVSEAILLGRNQLCGAYADFLSADASAFAVTVTSQGAARTSTTPGTTTNVSTSTTSVTSSTASSTSTSGNTIIDSGGPIVTQGVTTATTDSMTKSTGSVTTVSGNSTATSGDAGPTSVPKYGSGNHGTTPFPPLQHFQDGFFKFMHPRHLFGAGEPAAHEVKAMRDMHHARQRVIAGYRDAVYKAVDDYMDANPGGPYREAVRHAVANVDLTPVDAGASRATPVAVGPSAPRRTEAAGGRKKVNGLRYQAAGAAEANETEIMTSAAVPMKDRFMVARFFELE